MSAALLLAALLGAAPAAAPTAAAAPGTTAAGPRPLLSDRPVTMDAEAVTFSWKTRHVEVVGRPYVTLVHDDATLTCRKLLGDNDAQGKLVRAVCEGEVKLVRGGRVVTCDRATYDRPAARVVCTGKPELKDPGGAVATGTTLTYDLGADEVRLEGAATITVPSGQVDLATQRGVTGGRP